jgi:hypothetical protein
MLQSMCALVAMDLLGGQRSLADDYQLGVHAWCHVTGHGIAQKQRDDRNGNTRRYLDRAASTNDATWHWPACQYAANQVQPEGFSVRPLPKLGYCQ